MQSDVGLTFAIDKFIAEKLFNTQIADKIVTKIANEAEKMQLNRIAQGYDINSVRFKKYTPAYERFKQKFITGSFKKRKKPSKTLRRLNAKKGAFQARNVYDFMRLTGNLEREMTVDGKVLSINQREINLRLIYKIPKDLEPQAEGLIKQGRQFFGAAKKGSFYNDEQKRYKQIVQRILEDL